MESKSIRFIGILQVVERLRHVTMSGLARNGLRSGRAVIGFISTVTVERKQKKPEHHPFR